ncbi:isocitrate lyase [Rhodococcus jostii]|uniref:isocitrate lyase n=1 Tax=Rhodococcus jostii TaxID=132919 RepID=UPI0036278285
MSKTNSSENDGTALATHNIVLHDRAERLAHTWQTDSRWAGVTRDYSAHDVVRLQGNVVEEYTLARRGSTILWDLLRQDGYVNAFGTLTGHQAVQQVQAGIRAVYVSGWQVAADGNLSGHTYPDQSLYPANSVPTLVRRINNALQRADQIAFCNSDFSVENWMAPIVADAEAGFGGPVNGFELMKAMIQAGAAAVHWEDQLAPAKKFGEAGGKVIVPTAHHIEVLTAARLAADVMHVPSLIMARTDAESALYLTSDADPRDAPFLTGERTREGYYGVHRGIDSCISRAKSYAPYADILWMETSKVDLGYARKFAEQILAEFPDKTLAYNCYPGIAWSEKLSESEIARFQKEIGAMGFKFQFITLGGFHVLNHATFDFALNYARTGMSAYAHLQDRELAAEADGFRGTSAANFVGGQYFDLLGSTLSGTSAWTGSGLRN